MGDIAVLYASLLITLATRYGEDFGRQFDIHLLPFSIIFLVWLVVFYITNFYDISFSKNNIQFISTLLYSIAVNAAIAAFFFYLIPLFGIAPKTNLLIFMAIATALESGWRFGFNYLLVKSGHRNNTLLIGNNSQAQELYDFLLANPQLGFHALGIIDVEDQSAQQILEELIKQKNVANIIISPSAYKIPHIVDVFYRLIGFKINFYNLSDFYERTTGRIPLGTIDQVWFLENLSERGKRGYELSKRLLDAIFAIIIGAITLALSPFIALAIKLDSRGPIFYRQKRTGHASKNFELIKFRTMNQGAENKTGPIWAAESDLRATRVGRFMRRTRIDELPQVWNILKGEMSFIGPRPERPEFYERLHLEIPFYEARYLVKPGLLGWAQIKHKLDFRGGMTIQDTYEKLQHDLYYIKNRSFALDFGIVLKTINILLKKTLQRTS
ncbi:MAG: sugar transferase [Candidatus Yanofskybacteria bacterium]|nr:sugar transferase [Candidatus Yanofskybacteria bacterium]